MDFPCDFLMNCNSRFFSAAVQPVRQTDRPQAANLLIDRGQLRDQILKAMVLAYLLGRLAKRDWRRERLGHAFAFDFPQ